MIFTTVLSSYEFYWFSFLCVTWEKPRSFTKFLELVISLEFYIPGSASGQTKECSTGSHNQNEEAQEEMQAPGTLRVQSMQKSFKMSFKAASS